jgi:uncharacterized protein YyaL (SSP411 family)
MKDDYDGAEPSGNSVALLNLLRLARLTNSPEFQTAVERTLGGLAARISQQPVAVPQMLAGLDEYLSPKRQIILAGERHSEQTRAFIKVLRTRFLPATTLIVADIDKDYARLAQLVPEVTEMKQINDQTTAYVCENFACQLPTTDIKQFDRLLQ